MNTNKIVITKEQETELKWATVAINQDYVKVSHLQQYGLDLVTSARLVSGEAYVLKDFKVGDIVYDKTDRILRQIVSDKDEVIKCKGTYMNTVGWINSEKSRYELVGKVTV